MYQKRMLVFLAALVIIQNVATSTVVAASKSIAVITFENLTGSAEHDWVGHGFAEALSDKLRMVDAIHTADRRELADLLRIEQLDPKKIGAGDPKEIGRLIGCDYLILGAVQCSPGKDLASSALRVTARLVDTRTGRISKAMTKDGEMRKIFAFERDFALAFAEHLKGKSEISLSEKEQMAREGTHSLKAYQAYCRGLAALDARAFEKAVEHFKEAMKLHPGILYADAHYSLGTTYLRSGQKKRMLTEFKKDTESFAPIWFNLGQAYEKAGKTDEAIKAYTTFVTYTGRRVSPWKVEDGKKPNLSSSCIDASVSIMYDDEGVIKAYDTQSGMLRWRKQLASLTCPPTITSDNKVIVSTSDNGLTCLNAEDGSTQWQAPQGVAPQDSMRMLQATGNYLVGFTSNNMIVVYAIDSKTKLWHQQSKDAITDAKINVETTRMVFACRNGSIRCLSLDRGKQEWELNGMPAIQRFVGQDKGILGICEDGTVRPLGEKILRPPLMRAIRPEKTAADATGIASIGNNGALRYTSHDAAKEWSIETSDTIAALAMTTSTVACLEGDKTLRLFDRADGNMLYEQTFATPLTEIHAAGDNLLVQGESGEITAIGAETIARGATDQDAYLRLAALYHKKGDKGAALEACRLILERLHPAHKEAAELQQQLQAPSNPK